MKLLIKIYSICCFIIVAFMIFFMIPFELVPFGGAAVSLLVGGGLLFVLIAYIYRLKTQEGIEFGWFLAEKKGFWLMSLGALGLALFLLGLVWLFAPNAVEPALENGAMPVGSVLVVMFWTALIFIFLFPTVTMYAEWTVHIRAWEVRKSAFSFVLATFCLGLATLFCSLFLEVINDIFIRISGTIQNTVLLVFAISAILAGIVYGFYRDPSDLTPDDNLEVSDNRL